MQLLTATLIPVTIALMPGIAAVAAESRSSYYKTFESRVDFQTDPRRQLKTTGQIEWSKGQLTLKPGSSFEKPLNAGPQVDCGLKVDFGNATANGLVSETTIVFEVQDTVDTLTSLQTGSGVSMAAEIRVERSGPALEAVVRVSQFPRKEREYERSKYSLEYFRVQVVERRIELPASAPGFLWNISYNHGLVLFWCGDKVPAAGWHQNFVANVTGLRVIQKRGELHCRGMLLRGKVRPPAMNAFLLAQMMTVAANDLQGHRAYHSGKFQEALSRYQKSYEISRSVFGPEHFYTVASAVNVALIYDHLGDYARAEQLFRESVAISRRIYGDVHPESSVGIADLAGLYISLSDFAKAEPLLLESLKLNRLVFGDEHPHTAALFSNLGALYSRMGDPDRAESFCQQALTVRKKIFGDSGTETAWSFENLASLCVARRDYSRAQRLYEQALQIYTRAYGLENGRSASIVNQLGVLYEQLADFDQAERNYRRALATWEKVVGPDAPAYAMCLNNLGLLYQHAGDDAKAGPLCCKSLEIMERNVARTSGILSERQQIEWIASERYLLDVYLNLGAAAKIDPAERYRHCLRWKGAVFVAQAQMRLLRENPELSGLFAELQSISGQLAALAYRTPDPKQIAGWKSLVRDLTERKESIEQKLAAKNSDFRSQRASLEVEPDQVRAVLADDVALIDCLEYTHYVRSSEKGKMKRERRLAAFVVQHGRPTRFVDLAPVEVIRKNVEAWRSSFGDSAEAVTAARELRKTVWQPIEPFLNGVQTVLLSPDGDLARFPLGALPSKNGTGYLIEDVSLVIVPVPRLLPEFAVRREKRPSAPSALFIGDVAFDAETRGVTPDDAGKTLLADATRRPAVRFGSVYFPPLPGSAAEIEQIANMHARQFGAGQQSVLSGNLATEETFRNLAPRSTTLHLATHGFFQPVHERINSARADDPELTSFGDRERVVEFHPGLQCGLALAGANHKTTSKQSLDVRLGDDGILTAVEVASLDLRNVDLVTLSACETGLGKTASGEGVLGLQRAFQIAGARNVVASLWRVDDQGTAALMRLFYRKLWVEKKKPATALREAELAILRDPSQVESQANTRGPRYDAAVKLKATSQKSGSRPTASPRLWAAFILSGDWR